MSVKAVICQVYCITGDWVYSVQTVMFYCMQLCNKYVCQSFVREYVDVRVFEQSDPHSVSGAYAPESFFYNVHQTIGSQ